MPPRLDDLTTEEIFARLRQTNDPELRVHLIERHEGLVRHVAREYSLAGESFEDLISVGHVGLINAVDRFDPERGTRFATFAVPTIKGEIRRHFRDQGWSIRVPRRLQELVQRVKHHTEAAVQQRGRAPTYPELAAALNVREEEIVEAFEVAGQYDLLSTSSSPSENEDGRVGEDRSGALDPELEGIGDRAEISAALRQLPKREQVIVVLRYYRDMSQTEIASRLGISQMHVSRLQHRALQRLRRTLSELRGGAS